MLAICEICHRELTPTSYSDEHHLIPKSRGGAYTDKIKIHRICHDKIHSIWTENELAAYYNTPERMLVNEDLQKFIKWVSKKDPTFYTKTKRQRR